MNVTRIFTGPDGQSHFEDIVVKLNDLGPMGLISGIIPTNGLQFRQVSGDYHLDFHRAPRRQYVFNLTGSVEIEIGDDLLGQQWQLVSSGHSWAFDGVGPTVKIASMSLSADQAWRLLTNNYDAVRHGRLETSGDPEIVETMINTRAIIGTPK